MKKVYRKEENSDYWDRRWAVTNRDPDKFDNKEIYPVRFAEMVMTDARQRALELGAGLGRILKHYYHAGFNIEGIERSPVAVKRLKEEKPDLPIILGDAMSLPYGADEFDVIMAFGVFHNIENGLERALKEAARCLKPGGKFAISMRPDNIEMRFNEWYWTVKNRHIRAANKTFHKWVVSEKEFRNILERLNLRTDSLHRARNVSLLYRIPALRGNFSSETDRRSAGYQLNIIGRAMDRLLTFIAPAQFCNVLVYVGHKTG